MQGNRKALGQYMTPDVVANLVARHIPSDASAVIDLAAGDCSLLRAMRRRKPAAQLFGFEIDPDMHRRAQQHSPFANITFGNGLTEGLHAELTKQNRIAVVGNPPFAEMAPSAPTQRVLLQAFPQLKTKHGGRRAEVYFLARSLLVAKATKGTVAILMPISFADGDIYTQYRSELMQNYCVRKAIEIPGSAFSATEARTVLLVIDTGCGCTNEVEIGRFNMQTKKVEAIFKGQLEPGQRLDARYYDGRAEFDATLLKLKDVGVTITRGQYSHKEAKSLALGAIHTSDLARATNGRLSIGRSRSTRNDSAHLPDDSIALPGDILLPRTGTRVNWSAVFVASGSAPITDHVFRIRAPRSSLEVVRKAFMHPCFTTWLKCTAKGVCATVLTKRELLSMPLFAEPRLFPHSDHAMVTS
jgi:predicted RNA methylase